MMKSQDKFFSGLKVVEFASVLAGPAVGMFFAELGAEVLKIENKTTGGDVTRGWKQSVEDPASPVSAYWCSVNWGKQYLMLDLKDAAERQQALELVARADVVISNFKPSSARKMGLDADTLCALYPRLIYAQLNAYADPEDERPAFDAVLQAEAGFMFMTGEADRPPAKMPVALIDILAAHQLKEGILLALLGRAQHGKGAVVSASLMESALASLANQAGNYLMNGQVAGRMGTKHPNIAPYGDTYVCRDGGIVLMAAGTERQFEALCEVLNRQALKSDNRFSTNAQRVIHRTALNEALQNAVSGFGLDELIAACGKAGVPAARIRDMRSVFELPEARAMVLESTGPDGRPAKCMKTVVFDLKTNS